MIIFFENFGLHFDSIKAGTWSPVEKVPFITMGKRPKISNSGVKVPFLIVLKWTPKLEKKNCCPYYSGWKALKQ
jgi:hypothetical protein